MSEQTVWTPLRDQIFALKKGELNLHITDNGEWLRIRTPQNFPYFSIGLPDNWRLCERAPGTSAGVPVEVLQAMDDWLWQHRTQEDKTEYTVVAAWFAPLRNALLDAQAAPALAPPPVGCTPLTNAR